MSPETKTESSERPVAGPAESDSAAEPKSFVSKLDLVEKYFNWLSLVVAVAVIAISGLSAGPVWRDEINSLNIAHRPLATIGQWSSLDTVPAVHFLVFRLGTLIFPGGEIVATRITGVLVCLGCLLAFVGTANTLGKRGPYFIATFLLLQPFFVRYLLTARMYGVSTLFGILCVWSFWNYFSRGGRKNWAWAAVLGLLFLHSNYVDALYYVLITGSIFVFFWLHRQGRQAALVAMTAAGSLSTMLVYVPGVQYMRHATAYLFSQVSLGTYVATTADYLGGGFPILYYGSLGLILMGLVWSLIMQPTNKAIWLGVILAVGCPLLHHLFLWQAGSPYSNWYLLIPATLAALGAEVALDQAVRLSSRAPLWRVLRLGLGGLILLVLLPLNYNGMTERLTNMDAVAAYVEKEGRPGDYLIVVPFYLGNSFHYYYRGAIPWQSIPAMPDFSVQRFDLMLPYVQNLKGGQQTSPVIGLGREALRKGGRLWVVGQPDLHAPLGMIEKFQVPVGATLNEKYLMLTGIAQIQVGELMRTRVSRVSKINLLPGTAVNKWERVDLYLVEP